MYYQINNQRFCLKAHQLKTEQETINLTGKTAAALKLFLHEAQIVISKDEFMQAV